MPVKSQSLPTVTPASFAGLSDAQIQANMEEATKELERRKNMKLLEDSFNSAVEYSENPYGNWAIRVEGSYRDTWITIAIHEGHYLDVIAKINEFMNVSNVETGEYLTRFNLIRAEKLKANSIKREERELTITLPQGMKLNAYSAEIVESTFRSWLGLLASKVKATITFAGYSTFRIKIKR